MPHHRLYFVFILSCVLAYPSAAQTSTPKTVTPASENPPAAQTSTPASENPPATTSGSENLPMTTREQALEKARIGAGRDNPFSPITSTSDFPFGSKADVKPVKQTTPASSSFAKTGLVPPPPPVMAGSSAVVPGEAKSNLALPEPPAKPRLVEALKLVGIVGQKAVFVFSDRQLRKINNWPRALLLSPGEQFESVNLISVDDHLVTLEEDGMRTTKALEEIR